MDYFMALAIALAVRALATILAPYPGFPTTDGACRP